MSMTKKQRRDLEWSQWDMAEAERRRDLAEHRLEQVRFVLLELYRLHYGPSTESVEEIEAKLLLEVGDLWARTEALDPS